MAAAGYSPDKPKATEVTILCWDFSSISSCGEAIGLTAGRAGSGPTSTPAGVAPGGSTDSCTTWILPLPRETWMHFLAPGLSPGPAPAVQALVCLASTQRISKT